MPSVTLELIERTIPLGHVTDRASLLDSIALGMRLQEDTLYWYLIDNDGFIVKTVDAALARWYQKDNSLCL